MSRLSEPALYRRVHQLVRLYGLQKFVETGCGPECDGIRTAIALRLEPWSCDINHDFVDLARKLGAHASPLESTEFLRWVLTEPSFGLGAPTLFFLDAHFPEYPEYGNQGTTAPQWPLLSELEAIRAHKAGYERDVILCDDMRCIEDLQNPRWDPKEMEGSTLVQKGVAFKEYTAVFAGTHAWQVFPEFEGVLCFTPKGEKC